MLLTFRSFQARFTTWSANSEERRAGDEGVQPPLLIAPSAQWQFLCGWEFIADNSRLLERQPAMKKATAGGGFDNGLAADGHGGKGTSNHEIS